MTCPDGAPKFILISTDGNDFINKQVTDFEFSKRWFYGETVMPWPENKSIEVTFYRQLYGENNAAIGDAETLGVYAVTNTTITAKDGFPATAPAFTSVTGTYTTTNLDVIGTVNNQTGTWKYYVVETNPDPRYSVGYAVSTTNLTVVAGKTQAENGQVIVNTEWGYEMPSTGGMGTTLLYALGSLLTVLAAALLIIRKRSDGAGID